MGGIRRAEVEEAKLYIKINEKVICIPMRYKYL